MFKYVIKGRVIDTNGDEQLYSNQYIVEAESEPEARRLYLIEILRVALDSLDNAYVPWAPQKAEVISIQPWFDNFRVSMSIDGGRKTTDLVVSALDENHARALAMRQWLQSDPDGDVYELDYNYIEVTNVELLPHEEE